MIMQTLNLKQDGVYILLHTLLDDLEHCVGAMGEMKEDFDTLCTVVY